MQGVRKKGRIEDVFVGALPFVLTMLDFVMLIYAFPQIVMWLPQSLR